MALCQASEKEKQEEKKKRIKERKTKKTLRQLEGERGEGEERHSRSYSVTHSSQLCLPWFHLSHDTRSPSGSTKAKPAQAAATVTHKGK